jgi:endonuclease YncB( thermonuclease family)
MKPAAFFLLFAVLLPTPAFAQNTIAGNASVIDGDTIEIHNIRIRIEGIDAPESSQLCIRNDQKYRCGREATFALADLIGRDVVTCSQTTTDRYGRMVAICEVEGMDIGRWMVQHGHAIAYRKYSMVYVSDEDQARAAKVGLWAGEFQNPAEYRHQPRRPPPIAEMRTHPCLCPDDVDRAGRRCRKRSVLSRSGANVERCAKQ